MESSGIFEEFSYQKPERKSLLKIPIFKNSFIGPNIYKLKFLDVPLHWLFVCLCWRCEQELLGTFLWGYLDEDQDQ